MDAEKAVWCIAITFADPASKGFVTLGGAGWESRVECDQEWGKIPAAPTDRNYPNKLFADKLDRNGDRLEERPITVATVEALLGKPLDVLIAEGRASVCSVLPRFCNHPEGVCP
ncbi:hypothetical protein ACSI09_002280 [Escherichia coli]